MGRNNSIISALANVFAAVPGQVWGNEKNGNGNDDIGSFEDRVQIKRLLYTYGYAVDATDHDTGKAQYLSIFSDDAEYATPKSGSFIGKGDNPPGSSGPGGLGWLYSNIVFPGQIQSLILFTNIDIKITGNRASVQDAFYRTGYKEWNCGEGYYWKPGNYDLEPPQMDAEKLEITTGRHYWKCKKIKGLWKITWFQGQMINSNAIVGPPECIEVPESSVG